MPAAKRKKSNPTCSLTILKKKPRDRDWGESCAKHGSRYQYGASNLPFLLSLGFFFSVSEMLCRRRARHRLSVFSGLRPPGASPSRLQTVGPSSPVPRNVRTGWVFVPIWVRVKGRVAVCWAPVELEDYPWATGRSSGRAQRGRPLDSRGAGHARRCRPSGLGQLGSTGRAWCSLADNKYDYCGYVVSWQDLSFPPPIYGSKPLRGVHALIQPYNFIIFSFAFEN